MSGWEHKIIEFGNDGSVKINPRYTPDRAARETLRLFQKQWHEAIKTAEKRGMLKAAEMVREIREFQSELYEADSGWAGSTYVGEYDAEEIAKEIEQQIRKEAEK